MNNDYKIQVGRPGGIHSDFQFSIDGVWSEKGYVSKTAARNAAWRKIEKMEKIKAA